MYLGQMSEQLEAINYFQQGVNLMIAERATMPQDLTKGSTYLALSSKISSALCSMTDIYLTDCWYVTEHVSIEKEIRNLFYFSLLDSAAAIGISIGYSADQIHIL